MGKKRKKQSKIKKGTMKGLSLLSRASSNTLTAEDCELIRDMTEMIKLVQRVDDLERISEKDVSIEQLQMIIDRLS